MAALRQALGLMHTWLGVLSGAVLYFMFLTGSAGYFDTEIDRWMRPEHPRPPLVRDAAAAFETGIRFLEAVAPDADSWFVRIPLTRSYSPFIEISWQGTVASGEATSGRAELDIRTGGPVVQARDTGGGQALYLLHYVFHYVPQNWGEWLAGLAALFMFGALVSGVVIHKRIFRDFFTFRPGSGPRAWLDAHNVTSVLTLPYQVMITFSGIVTLAVFYFPLIVAANFGTGAQGESRFYDALYGAWSIPERAGEAVDSVSLRQILAAADAHWPEESVVMLSVHNPGDRNARIEIMGDISASLLRGVPQLTFDGVSGELLEASPRPNAGSLAVSAVVQGLHEGLFAGVFLRWLLFISALLGAAMVATGLVLWARKRRERTTANAPLHVGIALVERLNVGVIAGLPAAIAAYFWANRLLPVDFPGRAAWEMHTLFIVWGLALAHAFWNRPSRAWAAQCSVGATLFAFLPVLNGLTTQIHLGRTLPFPGQTADWPLAAVDLTMLGISAVLAAAARCCARRAEAGRQRSAGFARDFPA